jgi:GntR family transcriptional regulator
MSGPPAVEVRIDLSSSTPPYAQIHAQLAALIQTGALSDGVRLPTVRALAADLGVAPGTVARAYGELEADGLVLGRRRFGTTVIRNGSDPPSARLRGAALRLTAMAYADGHGRDDILAAVHAAIDEHDKQKHAAHRQ